jgi:hypothetical protein
MTSRAQDASPDWTGSFPSNWLYRRARSLSTFRAGRRCVLASPSNRRHRNRALRGGAGTRRSRDVEIRNVAAGCRWYRRDRPACCCRIGGQMSGQPLLQLCDACSVTATRGTDIQTASAVEKLLTELQKQEVSLLRRGGRYESENLRRSSRYRMVIDGPFIETKEFGNSRAGTSPSDRPRAA